MMGAVQKFGNEHGAKGFVRHLLEKIFIKGLGNFLGYPDNPGMGMVEPHSGFVPEKIPEQDPGQSDGKQPKWT